MIRNCGFGAEDTARDWLTDGEEKRMSVSILLGQEGLGPASSGRGVSGYEIAVMLVNREVNEARPSPLTAAGAA